MLKSLDKIDLALVTERLEFWERLKGPRRGDFLRLPTGELVAFNRWDDDLEAMLIRARVHPDWVFHLDDVPVGYVGSNKLAFNSSSLVETDEKKTNRFWIFHHGKLKVDTEVEFKAPCRVFELKD